MKVLFQNRDPKSWMGGDAIKIQRMIEGLRDLGVDVRFSHRISEEEARNVDIVHLVHLSMTWTKAHWKNAKTYGKKIVVNSIYHPVQCDGFTFQEQNELCNDASAIVCMSDEEKNLIGERTGFRDEKRFHIIPNGIDKMFYDVVGNTNRSYVMGAGRMMSGKGFHVLARACKELGYPLLIVGPKFEDGLLKTIKETYPQVVYLGEVPREMMPFLYGNARVFCSLSDWEVFSYTLLEAGASGCNIVYTNLALGGKTLPFIEVADVKNIENVKTKIKMQWEKGYSQDLSNWLKVNGFTWDVVCKKIKKIYEDICQEKK